MRCDARISEEQAYGKRRDVDGEGDGGRKIEELKRSSLEWERERRENGGGGKGEKYRRATLSQESCGRAPNC